MPWKTGDLRAEVLVGREEDYKKTYLETNESCNNCNFCIVTGLKRSRVWRLEEHICELYEMNSVERGRTRKECVGVLFMRWEREHMNGLYRFFFLVIPFSSHFI